MKCHYFFRLGVFITCAVMAGWPFSSEATDHGHKSHGHQKTEMAGVCRGFLVLKNGHAVMSGMDLKGKHGHGGHKIDHGKKMDHGKMAKSHDMKKMKGHLMGLKHGENIPASKGVLCVPVAGGSGDSWMAASADKMLKVHVRSTKGQLTHSSRENESLELTVTRHGKPVESAQVVLRSRMPHHDRQMPGGHGLSNDPDVEGIPAKAVGGGKYLVQTVDFSMAGAWLFEVHVKSKGSSSKAYFSTKVGN